MQLSPNGSDARPSRRSIWNYFRRRLDPREPGFSRSYEDQDFCFGVRSASGFCFGQTNYHYHVIDRSPSLRRMCGSLGAVWIPGAF
jgi:hypothetical protein